MTIRPNFLIIGASKSGTTSIYHYLQQHPDIFLSKIQKEGRYFSQMSDCFNGPGDESIRNSIPKDFDRYLSFFKDYSKEKAIGDISPEYLYFYSECIPLIKSKLGHNVKIIVILRSPIERAYSSYSHFKRDKRETLSFEDALQEEENRKIKKWLWSWQYKNSGLYYKQVKQYLENFNEVKVFLYEDLKENTPQLLKDLCEFINVDSTFEFDTRYKYNVSGDPKSQVLYQIESARKFIKLLKIFIPAKLVSFLKSRFTGEKQMIKSEMKPETRNYLKNFYRKDIIQLQNLIDRDLSKWFD